jgi:flavin reductase (DIM6/NTAB) family NADH-FMN oxidoreductase RutF
MSTMYPFERFTERAKEALTMAQEEAERSRHSYIGTEHLLLGVLRVTDGIGFKVLASLGVGAEEVRRVTESVLGRNERTLIQQIIPTSRVKKVIELSFEEARRMGHEYVGTEHLLLGLLLEGEGIAAHVLVDLGVTVEKVRPEIERLLRETNEEVRVLRPVSEPTLPGIDSERYRDVMAGFPSGVVIVTAFGQDGLPRGLTVNAFSAVSLNPPLALVCIDKTSNTLPAVQHTQGFTANILAAGREKLARLMATKVSDKFEGLEWRRSESDAGGPILTADTAAFAVCTLRETIEAGDHWILLGTVVDGGHQQGVEPMIYSRRQYRQL